MKLWVKIVIGMSVLFLLLFLIYGFGGFSHSTWEGGEDLLHDLDLPVDATIGNPLVISVDSVNSGGIKVTRVGFFNRNEEVVDVKMDITSCKRKNEEVSKEKIPGVESVSQEVKPNTIMDYEVKITENGLIPDTYICTLSAVDSNKPEIIYENKQFFLKVNE